MKEDLHLQGTVLALEFPAFCPAPIHDRAWGVVMLHASVSGATSLALRGCRNTFAVDMEAIECLYAQVQQLTQERVSP
jgi:hypothetical protein